MNRLKAIQSLKMPDEEKLAKLKELSGLLLDEYFDIAQLKGTSYAPHISDSVQDDLLSCLKAAKLVMDKIVKEVNPQKAVADKFPISSNIED